MQFPLYDAKGKELPFKFPGYVIGDTHFLHERLAQEYEPSRMALDNHNEVMIERWNEVVSPKDILLHLGDLCLGKKDDFPTIAQRLPGQKYLIRGNHDRRSRPWYYEQGFTSVPEFWMDYKGYRILFSHRPDSVSVTYPKHLNVHGHVHSKTLEDRRLINLSAEAIDFRPIWITDILDERIGETNA
jgi:calcineurin-like phosphoesterase family protein